MRLPFREAASSAGDIYSLHFVAELLEKTNKLLDFEINNKCDLYLSIKIWIWISQKLTDCSAHYVLQM